MPDLEGRSEPRSTFPFAFPPWALGAVLAALAFLGNLLHLPLFFGVDYVFGSIAALLAAVWLGPVAGVAVAAVGGLYTLELWGHPWGLAIFTLEAGIVGLLWRRLGDPVLADFLFWLIIGIPLIFLAYKGAMGMGWESAGLIALKQPVNGIFNALVARVVLYLVGLGRETVNLRQLVFNTLFGGIFLVGLVLIAVYTRTLHTVQEDLVGGILRDRRPAVVSQLQSALAESGDVENGAYPPIGTQMGIGLVLPDGRLLPARGLPEWIGRADKRDRGQGVTVWLPPVERQLPAMERWERGYYAVEAPLPTVEGVSAAVLTQSARPVVERLARANISAHGLLVLMALVGAVSSYFLATGLARPFRRLEEKVRGLPGRIEAGRRPELPATSVREASRLGAAFGEMARALEGSIRDLDAQRARLEERVRERTVHLEEANQALQERESTLYRLTEILEATPDFVGLGRPDGTVLYVNKGGRRLLGLPEKTISEAEFALRPIPETEFPENWGHPEWAYRIVRDEGMPTAVAHGQWEGETALIDNEGREIPVSQLILAHYDDQGELLQISTIMRDIRRNKELEERLQLRQNALQQLGRITADPQMALEAKVQGLLAVGSRVLGLPYGMVSQLEEGGCRIWKAVSPDDSLQPGYAPAFDVTACVHPLEPGEPVACHWPSGNGKPDPEGTLYETLASYLGIPIRMDGKVIGALCFFATEAREPFSDYEWDLFKLMGQWISNELTKEANRNRLEEERRLFIGGPTVVFRWRPREGWPVVYVSPNIETEFGYAPEEVREQPFADLVHPDDRERVVEAVRAYTQRGVPSIEQEYRLRNRAGAYRWVYDFTVPERDEEGAVTQYQGYLLDITDRRRMEEEQRLLAATFRTTQATMITDAEGVIQRVNPAFEAITGYSAEEVIGLTPRILSSGAHDQEFFDRVWEDVAREGAWEGEVWNRRKDGDIYPQWETINRITDENGRICNYVAVFHDISRQKQLEAELAHLASHDPLTGVYNRHQFELLLEQEMERAERYGTAFSLIMFDIDHFKAVNDRFGHDTGDEVLVTLTKVVKGRLRTADVLGRWGGEEFMILLPETPEDGGEKVAEGLRALVAEMDFPGPGRVTISAGVAGYRPGESQKALTKRVDDALYRAKEQGRDRVVTAT